MRVMAALLREPATVFDSPRWLKLRLICMTSLAFAQVAWYLCQHFSAVRRHVKFGGAAERSRGARGVA